MQRNESAIKAKELVMEYIAACDRRDFETARRYLSDNVSYGGLTGMGSFDKAEPYFKYLEHLNLPKLDVKNYMRNILIRNDYSN